MPLDGYAYLLSQGWSGKGSGLRNGAITRPLAIPQKRTLLGLGKDRDESFPFWDHVFTVAAKTIRVKIHNDESSSESGDAEKAEPSLPLPTLSRTSTGLLSNKRPTVGASASASVSVSASASGTATPNGEDSRPTSLQPRLSLVATAKREAARKNLYACFFRGPVLGPDPIQTGEGYKRECDKKIIAQTSTSAMCHSVVQAENRLSSMLVREGNLIKSTDIDNMPQTRKQLRKGERKKRSEGDAKKGKKEKRKDTEGDISKFKSKNDGGGGKERANGNETYEFSTTDRSADPKEGKDKNKKKRKRSEEVDRDDFSILDKVVDESSCNSKRKKRRKHRSTTAAMRMEFATAERLVDPDRLDRSKRIGSKGEKRRRGVEKKKKKVTA